MPLRGKPGHYRVPSTSTIGHPVGDIQQSEEVSEKHLVMLLSTKKLSSSNILFIAPMVKKNE